ncbi:efflux RND transporter periplasmic adaptor subunit [Flammeovirga kamogawensis]|uniref:Efflux RND transporter periplasmic adaptor subunit n=1 Tax=Flammeovirga kamogawensis TaxID=373891 RepID=A0ABX8H4F3_9BACT|nr:HlyD family efflux transporter periplasmic adaptor subunit [Flammeovirga kamogawensis]MBB6460481.1 HlyD family secretion protein [Flammeovirga kamogawensis]QWG10287.1 efflux RND transporter periplasmic adaptor subunit [Flammeovirga kamogawensis]TRX64735.1 HlyD family efflux transporter periplasmic adaptor subunit [Flammeovirga kamogawensis]
MNQLNHLSIMDKVISQKELKKNRLKKYSKGTVIFLLIVCSFLFINKYLTKSVDKDDITISVVEKGDVALTIMGSGQVEPTIQKAITSPFASFIEATSTSIGQEVKSTQSLLSINIAAAKYTLSSLVDEAAIKRVEINKTKLRLSKELFNLKKEVEINSLQLESKKEALKGEEKLLSIGGSTEEKVQLAKTQLAIEELKQDQLQHDLKIREQFIKQEIITLEYALSIQLKNIKEQERKLEKATAKAGIDGVITYINDKVGASVAEGEVLARVANMDHFRIKGKVSEQYVSILSVGMDVIGRTSKGKYNGTISSISPSSKNGMITLYVTLNKNEDLKDLRPEMVMDLQIIKEQHKNTLRVKNRGAFKGKLNEDLFLITGNQARKVNVKTGFRNTHWVEITSVLQEGDSIIISPTNKFENASFVDIK